MRFLTLFALLFLTSCYTSPSKFPVENTREYNLPYDTVWERVVEYFAISNTQIRTIEKDSGIIYAEAEFFTNKDADCGKIGRQKIKTAFGAMQHNVFVKKISKNKTKVLVNLRLSNALVPNALSNGNRRVQCHSLGTVEDDILRYVDSPVKEVIFKFKERD